ncbi:uncharacterized protein LOC126560642 [Anopheles maculipalpis]|uniref:uncharacterized protein LOC126560642 n=1 Tax=Anopheles maculipalpis TaxID=1496333 RepID=UPI002159494E|nr:uncharacterized protein LOC126560642 [Anopheles maculipalpis]
MEQLRPADEVEIRQLIQIYERNLPESVQFMLILQNILRIKTTVQRSEPETVSHRLRKTVYVPKKENNNHFATFVAISREDDLHIMAHSLENPPLELCSALETTSFIDWQRKPTFVVGGAKIVHELIHRKAQELSLQIDTAEYVNYWIPQEKAAKIEFVVPNDVLLKPLKKDHGKILNDMWPYRYGSSQWYIESAITHNGGLGLFDKTSEELVACVFKNDLDGIAHLYTVPDRNNRGYGSTLAKAMTRLIAVHHQQHVQTFITPQNSKSIRLFVKLGFVAVNKIYWLILH